MFCVCGGVGGWGGRGKLAIFRFAIPGVGTVLTMHEGTRMNF